MSWPRITDLLITDGPAEIGLIGVPMNLGAVTPGQYDRAPAVIRHALRRFSRYDVETGQELALPVRDYGDVDVARLSLEAGFGPVRDAVQSATGAHELTLVLGGHNGATRPAVHGLGLPLDKVGLVTLDAHFDLRDTDGGLLNGNPVRALLEDGLPGANICQIGLAPFANTAAMHGIAQAAGIGVYTMAELKRCGFPALWDEALARLSHVEAIAVDFDIDVIDRAQCPAPPVRGRGDGSGRLLCRGAAGGGAPAGAAGRPDGVRSGAGRGSGDRAHGSALGLRSAGRLRGAQVTRHAPRTRSGAPRMAVSPLKDRIAL
jgi:arginase family enzyme